MAKKTKTGGRTKGTPNKTTAENRQFFKSMFARLGPAIEGWIRKQAKKDRPRGGSGAEGSRVPYPEAAAGQFR